MAGYNIKKTDGTNFAVVVDGKINDTAASIPLIGKNSVDFGLAQNRTNIQMLENFANNTPPARPMSGQIWFDNSPGVFTPKIYLNDTKGWVPFQLSLSLNGSSVKQDVTFQGKVNFTAPVTTTSTVTFKNNVTVDQVDLTFNDTKIGGTPVFVSNVTFEEVVRFNSPVIFDSEFDFTAPSNFTADVTFNSSILVNANHNITTDSPVNTNSYVAFSELENTPAHKPSTTIVYSVPARGNDETTVLLLPFAGTDGSTSFSDISRGTVSNGGPNPDNTFTPVDATIDGFVAKSGSGSLKLNGTTGYLTIDDSANWDFGVGEFTIDTWVRFNDLSTSQVILSKGLSATDHFELIQNIGTAQFVFNDGSNSIDISGGTLFKETWHHIAVSKTTVGSNQRIDLYLDGDRVGTSTNPSATIDFSAITGNLTAGRREFGSNDYMNGNIDNLRIVKGVSKYKNTFTPRVSPITNESEMAMLTNLGFPAHFTYDFSNW